MITKTIAGRAHIHATRYLPITFSSVTLVSATHTQLRSRVRLTVAEACAPLEQQKPQILAGRSDQRLPQVQRERQLMQGSTVETVLIVDDDREAADALSLALQGYGHNVAAAYSAREALDLL